MSCRFGEVAFIFTSYIVFCLGEHSHLDGPSEDSGDTYTVALTKQHVPILKDGRIIGNKTSYFGDLYVGGNSDVFTVVFDTGSGHVILPSANCSARGCLKHRLYNHTQSPTSSSITKEARTSKAATATVTFGTGRVTATFVEDQVCLDKHSAHCLSLNLFAATNMTYDPFGLFDFDGVLGLGLSQLALTQRFHFLQALSTSQSQILPQFALFISDRSDGAGSQITFGGHDREKADSPFTWVPLINQDAGYWQLRVNSVRIGNEVLDVCSEGDCAAILDSGSSMLGVPKPQITTMHKLLARPVPEHLQHAELQDIDCRQVDGPTLTFDLGDVELDLTPAEIAKPEPWNVTRTVEDNATNVTISKLWCRHTLLPLALNQLGPKMFVFGEPVLRKYYSIFDYGQKRVGFSLANQLHNAPLSIKDH